MFILDTNVISDLRKVRFRKVGAGFTAWADSIVAVTLYISAITVLELETGVLQMERRDPAQGAMFRTWLDKQVLPEFTGRVLSVDTAVAQRRGRPHVPGRRAERDGLIAATGLVHGMTVVARNIEDFLPTGVMLLNPWEYSQEGKKR